MFRGQIPAVADYNLLDTARKVELYGIQMHSARVSNLSLWKDDIGFRMPLQIFTESEIFINWIEFIFS